MNIGNIILLIWAFGTLFIFFGLIICELCKKEKKL